MVMPVQVPGGGAETSNSLCKACRHHACWADCAEPQLFLTQGGPPCQRSALSTHRQGCTPLHTSAKLPQSPL